MSTRLPLLALLTLVVAPASAVGEPADCGWVDYDLKTGVYGPKQYWGDTNNAYAGTVVPSGPNYVYRFKGKFPNSRYMSIESSVFIDDGSVDQLGVAGQLQDLDDAIDQTIVPDAGSTNPFVEGASYPGADNYFTVDAVPEGVDWDSPNQFTIPADSGGSLKVVMISFRAISPNKDVQIAKEDLPTVEALDLTGAKVDCNWGGPVRTPEFYGLVRDLIEQAPSPDAGIGFADLLDVSEPSELIDNLRIARALLEVQYTTFEKWWPFRFHLVNIPFEGSAGIKGYLYGLTEMTPGNVAIIRFKAPSFLNTYSGEVKNFTSRTDVRFWSMCVTDFLGSVALACMPDHMTQPDRFGYVTVVFGPDDGEVEAKAKSLGYAFMADRRVAEDWEGKALAFIYRQVLPSPQFERFRLNRGAYVPTARVCSEGQFLRGSCSIP